MMRQILLRRAAAAGLWIAAIAGALCLLAVIVGATLGVRPLIFTSGSMSPTIDSGALALAHRVPADRVRVGDIVSVPYAGGRVTHRVVALTHEADGAASLRLKGDANRTADPDPYDVGAADRVWFAVPRLGSAITWLSRAPGLYLLAMYAAGLVVLILRRSSDRGAGGRTDDGRRHRRDARGAWRRPRLRRGLALSTAGALGALCLGAAPTWASWTDDVTVTGSTLTGYTVPPATIACTATGSWSATYTWPAVANATSYTLYLSSGAINDSITTTSTSATIGSAEVSKGLVSGNAWVVVNRNFGSVTWTSAKSNVGSYSLAFLSSTCT